MNSVAKNLFDDSETDQPAGKIAVVAFDSGVDNVFDYLLPDKLGDVLPGQRLEVPFGRANKISHGFCIEVKNAERDSSKRKLKFVKKIIDATPLLNETQLAFGKWISDFYVCPLGQVLSAMIPAAVKKGTGEKQIKHIYLADTQEHNLIPTALNNCARCTRASEAGINTSELLNAQSNMPTGIKSKKQKQIIDALKAANALDADSAIDLKNLLETLNIGTPVANKLLQAGIIKFTSQTFLKELPVAPAGMLLKTDKVILNAEQKNALDEIAKKIESEKFSVALLHGVTDSGKTEVYIRAIEKVLAKGKNAIVLLPEIALTAQTVQRFNCRFKNIAVMHCQLTASQRNAQWQKIKTTTPIVVIGARSAIFAPVSNLGIIVVDEEHESSYKQDTVPRYNGRDAAIKLAQMTDAVCLLGSATPSLETLYNCKTKKHFIYLSLPNRVMDLPKPEMKIIDMAGEKFAKGVNLISEELESALKQTLANKQQAILMLNRRGFSNFIFCPSCRYTLKCRNCDVALTFHKSEKLQKTTGLKGRVEGGFAMCHYCLSQTLVPQKCPMCGKAVTMFGLGSQRLEDELAAKLPDARIVRVDSDSMQKHDYYKLLADFDAGRIDILFGTQILAKGLHFPNVTLVGIISADSSLQIPDFRANERTYQLICQVAGRAGRGRKGGRVFIQTFLPNQPAIKFAVRNDFEGFVKEELKHRQLCLLPPFGRLALVRMRDTNFDRLTAASQTIAEQLTNLIGSLGLNIKLTGPMPATISRIQRFYRMQVILQTASPANFSTLFSNLRKLKPPNSCIQIQTDIDPVNLL
ncbi:MAG: primosomal protein N' [Phycisphaerae bacterium]|jgi:primosomal protein N' (replication factor Y)